MRKSVHFIIIAIAAMLVGSLWYLSFSKISKKKAAIEKIKYLPAIELVTSQNEKIILTDLSSDEIKLIIYFNTHCDFCQFELEELEKRLPEFGNIEIMLISAEHIDSLITLQQQFVEQCNVRIYHCNYKQLTKHFGKISSPTSFIYNSNGKLLKRFNGSTRIDDILEVIRLAECNDDSKENTTSKNE